MPRINYEVPVKMDVIIANVLLFEGAHGSQRTAVMVTQAHRDAALQLVRHGLHQFPVEGRRTMEQLARTVERITWPNHQSLVIHAAEGFLQQIGAIGPLGVFTDACRRKLGLPEFISNEGAA
jgi:hypothetical protein